MRDDIPTQRDFPKLNRAYNTVFQQGRLSLGVVVPIEAYSASAVPSLERHIERARLVDDLGFAALWLRDVPFNVPSFGDAGQVFDPFVYLGALASVTRNVGLGVASIVLPLRHPAHVAKAAASADVLSGGRVLLGVASGDRPDEYPALSMRFDDRGARFRDSMAYMRDMARDFPQAVHAQGHLSGAIDMLPKPTAGRVPLLITGGSQQAPEWLAAHGDGWMTYPRDLHTQARVIAAYRDQVQASQTAPKPVMQSLYIDVLPDYDAPPRPIHLGFASGMTFLREHLKALEALGVHHVALNLRFNRQDVEDTLKTIADSLLPDFSHEGVTT